MAHRTTGASDEFGSRERMKSGWIRRGEEADTNGAENRFCKRQARARAGRGGRLRPGHFFARASVRLIEGPKQLNPASAWCATKPPAPGIGRSKPKAGQIPDP